MEEKVMFKMSSAIEVILHSNYIERFLHERCRVEDEEEIWHYFFKYPQVAFAIVNNYKMSNVEKQRKFIREYLLKPNLISVCGAKGSGKTCFAFWAAEQWHNITKRNVCVFRPLDFRPDLLPDYFYPAFEDFEIQADDLMIYDEAAIFLSSRRSMQREHIDFSAYLAIQRHKGNPAIIIQQVYAMTDKNVFRLADGFIIKKGSEIQSEIKEVSDKNPVDLFLKVLKPLNVQETFFTNSEMSDIFFFTNPKPTFWCDALSTPGSRFENILQALDYILKMHNFGTNLKNLERLVKLKGLDFSKSEIQDFLRNPERWKRYYANKIKNKQNE